MNVDVWVMEGMQVLVGGGGGSGGGGGGSGGGGGVVLFFFFFNDTATTEIYTLSLHDALPILMSPTLVLKVQQQISSLALLRAQAQVQ